MLFVKNTHVNQKGNRTDRLSYIVTPLLPNVFLHFSCTNHTLVVYLQKFSHLRLVELVGTQKTSLSLVVTKNKNFVNKNQFVWFEFGRNYLIAPPNQSFLFKFGYFNGVWRKKMYEFQ